MCFFSLEIKDAMVEDSGLYFLKLSNDYGNTQSSANILVKGKYSKKEYSCYLNQLTA